MRRDAWDRLLPHVFREAWEEMSEAGISTEVGSPEYALAFQQWNAEDRPENLYEWIGRFCDWNDIGTPRTKEDGVDGVRAFAATPTQTEAHSNG